LIRVLFRELKKFKRGINGVPMGGKPSKMDTPFKGAIWIAPSLNLSGGKLMGPKGVNS